MSAHILMNIDKIPDQQGYIVVTTDGVMLASCGDLQNNEKLAKHICNMVSIASGVYLNESKETFKRLSVSYPEFTLLITVNSQKIYIVKRPNETS